MDGVHLGHLTTGEGVNRHVHFNHHAGSEERAQHRRDRDLKRLKERRRSILVLHKAVKRLDTRVFDCVEMIAKAERHFNTRIR